MRQNTLGKNAQNLRNILDNTEYPQKERRKSILQKKYLNKY